MFFLQIKNASKIANNCTDSNILQSLYDFLIDSENIQSLFYSDWIYLCKQYLYENIMVVCSLF
jgi:hypothetical protein